MSLREELAGTTLALEDYKNAMKDSGEKGDSAKQYAEAWKLAIDSINEGRVDSNAVREAGNLFFSDEQLAAMGYDLEKVGQALNSRLMQAIFATDENGEEQLDYGVKLANYIRENANLFDNVAGVSSTANGGFTFWYKSLEDLSRVLNIDAGAVSALLDALDAFGIEAMRSTDENNELIQQFYRIKAAAGESGDAVKDFISALMQDGADNFTISQIITDLQSWGIIKEDVSDLGGLINAVRENLGDLSEEEPEATANLNTDPAYTALNDIDAALTEWANSVYTATATVNYVEGEQPSNSSSSSHGTVRPGTRTPGYSTGTKNAPGGKVLLNEKGAELVSDNGEAYIANGGKPGFANVGKGAVIFTADETKQIFAHTYRNIPVKAFANGTPETVNKSAIRERLISGGKVKGLYTGGVSKTFTCVKCGHSWNYSPIDYPSGPTGACPKCGAYYSNGAYQYGGNAVSPQHQNDDYYGYDVTTGNQIDNYDDIYNNYAEHGYYGPQDSYYDSGYIHEKLCPNCGNAIAFNLVVCPHCGYNYATGKAQIKANQSINQGAKNAKQENPKGSSGYVGNGGGSSVGRADYSSQAEPQKVDWISVLINRIQKAVAALEKIASSGFKKLSTRITAATGEVSELTKQIDVNEQAYRRYIQEAESVGLSSDLEELVKDGTINIEEYDDETRKLIDSYSEWMEKAINAQYAVEELHQEIADIYQDIFDMTRTDYNNQLAVIEHDVNMLEKSMRLSQTRGYLDSAEYYKQLIDIENENISALNAELADLTAAFQNALNSGEIEAGSESFYDMRLSILSVEEALVDADNKLKEYAKTMRSIKWGYFDYAMGTFGQLQNEADFLISVMSNDKLFDDLGKFADKGTATMGLRVMNYNAYMKQADEYAQEMQKIERELAANQFDTELIERRRLLLELQRKSIQAAESEKDAMKDLVSQGIQLEINALKELISEYEDSLSSARDLYTYQKKISEKTDDIAKIEKQLTAYQNDQSQENRARVQQLQAQLKKAREDLEETEWEQNIKEQKKLLDSLSEEYEAYMNSRLDDLEGLVQEMVDGVNVNAANIQEELCHSAEQVGYTITDGMSSMLDDGFYSYYDGIFTDMTSVNRYLDSINRKLDEMISAADSSAKSAAAHKDTHPMPGNSANGTSNSANDDLLIEDLIVDDSYSNISAPAGSKVGSRGYRLRVSEDEAIAELVKARYSIVKNLGLTTATGGKLEVLDTVLEEIKERKPNVFSKLFTAYSTGGLADYTGLAMLHGTKTKPELVLNAGDTDKILAAVKITQRPQLAIRDNPSLKNLMNMHPVHDILASGGGASIGDVIINIDHVQDYNDFVRQLRNDPKFEKLISAMTFDPMKGKSSFGSKNRIVF